MRTIFRFSFLGLSSQRNWSVRSPVNTTRGLLESYALRGRVTLSRFAVTRSVIVKSISLLSFHYNVNSFILC
ncbi:hypothetical protein Plhal703r1_c07g0042001 [Plasmopara halstedii]